jgi:hypothetical protein
LFALPRHQAHWGKQQEPSTTVPHARQAYPIDNLAEALAEISPPATPTCRNSCSRVRDGMAAILAYLQSIQSRDF